MAKKLNKETCTFIAENGETITRQIYTNLLGLIHHPCEPAVIDYYNTGTVVAKFYFNNNKVHNENGPAVLKYDRQGRLTEEGFYLNNKIHRLGDWAIRSKEINKEDALTTVTYSWHLQGLMHRADGPAWIQYCDETGTHSAAYAICGEIIKNETYLNLIEWYDHNLFDPDTPLCEEQLILRKIQLGF